MKRTSGWRVILWVVIIILAGLILSTAVYLLMPKPADPLATLPSLFWAAERAW